MIKEANLSPRLELNYNILQTFRKLFVLNPSIFKQTSSITRLRVSIGAQAICGVIINFVASLISNKGLLQQNGSFSKTSKPAHAKRCSFNASTKSASFTIFPLPTLIKYAESFIFAKADWSKRFSV